MVLTVFIPTNQDIQSHIHKNFIELTIEVISFDRVEIAEIPTSMVK